jgi:signal transduction histidine kinase
MHWTSWLKFKDETNRNSLAAYLLVVLVGYVIIFTSNSFSTAEIMLLVILGLAYIIIGTLIWDRLDGSAGQLTAYFIVQLALSGLIVFVGKGNGWLVPMPLVSHAIAVLRRPWSWLVVGCVLAVEVIPLGLIAGFEHLPNFILSLLAAVVFVAIFTQLTVDEQRARAEVQRLADELAQANLKLAEYANKVEELAIIQERNRMAREIHDGLGHYLTAANMQIKAALAVLVEQPELARDAMGKAQTLTQEALNDVRRSVAALRSAPEEQRPLVEAISALAMSSPTESLQIHFELLGEPRTLLPQAELTLYRAAQEGLTNVNKHAKAQNAWVSLDFTGGHVVRLRVRDDGIGMRLDGTVSEGKVHGEHPPLEGFGLMGLRERVLLVGGQLRINSSASNGSILEVEVPG